MKDCMRIRYAATMILNASLVLCLFLAVAEKLLSIPVATIIPRDSVIRAIEVAARKIE